MNIALWVAQGLLALAFGMAGMMKAGQSKEKLTASKNMEWAKDFSPTSLKVIGILEVLAAIGLIAPMLTGILPWLTPLAAVGLILTMIGATLTHLRRNETQGAITNVVLLLIAAFVAYGRFMGA
ncbi:MAG: DoxX family protein [Anaerolineae bacterium]|nr:DoxX family protein [Anaerolineae bacterium]